MSEREKAPTRRKAFASSSLLLLLEREKRGSEEATSGAIFRFRARSTRRRSRGASKWSGWRCELTTSLPSFLCLSPWRCRDGRRDFLRALQNEIAITAREIERQNEVHASSLAAQLNGLRENATLIRQPTGQRRRSCMNTETEERQGRDPRKVCRTIDS